MKAVTDTEKHQDSWKKAVTDTEKHQDSWKKAVNNTEKHQDSWKKAKPKISWCGVQCESFASAPASRPLGTCEEKQCEYSHGSCQSLEKPG